MLKFILVLVLIYVVYYAIVLGYEYFKAPKQTVVNKNLTNYRVGTPDNNAIEVEDVVLGDDAQQALKKN